MRVLIFLKYLVSTFFVVVNVTSASMSSTLETGDRAIGVKADVFVQEYERYDIVVFRSSVYDEGLYIKRIVGLPNETVRVSNGKIYINNSEEPIAEKYLKESWVVDNDGYEFNIPDNAYLVLGDNRNNSEDSRYWKNIAIEKKIAYNEYEAEYYQYVQEKDICAKIIYCLQ